MIKYVTNYLISSLLIILLITSCGNRLMIAPPENIVPEEKIEDVLVEMFLIEAQMRLRIGNEPIDELKTWLNVEINNLLKKHNIDYKQYTDSYIYYMADLEVSKKMMENAVNCLLRMQAEQVPVQEIKQVN